MVILLIALSFMLFLLIDWLVPPSTVSDGQAASKQLAEARPLALGRPLCVAGFQVQPEMCYHLGHAWAVIEGPSRTRVGIDDFAARLVGDADRIDLPCPGDRIVQGQPAWVLHHGNREAPMLSPVTGEVVAVNPRARNGKVSLSSAPYTHGWLLSVRVSDPRTDFNNLLRGDLPLKWIEMASARLETRLSRGVAVSFRDGGTAARNICDMVDEAQWNDVVHEFLLAEPNGACRPKHESPR